MEYLEITENKKKYLPLLLLADEQENMIDRYIDRGRMFVLSDGGEVRAECVVCDEGNGILEIKNLAVPSALQKQGYGKAMIDYLTGKFRGCFSVLQVGTGDSPLTVPFYEKCGFTRSYTIKDFFTDNYEKPIYECGIRLTDMVVLRKSL